MPPKKAPPGPSKKTEQKKKEKVIEVGCESGKAAGSAPAVHLPASQTS